MAAERFGCDTNFVGLHVQEARVLVLSRKSLKKGMSAFPFYRLKEGEAQNVHRSLRILPGLPYLVQQSVV